jgi:hypothetical protein
LEAPNIRSPREETVPLSEEELRLLEQMERALQAEDPKFVSALQGRTLERTARLRALGAGVVFLGGVAMLLGGAMAQLIWLSIVGFVVMLASATLGLTAWRGRHAPRERPLDPFERAAQPDPHEPRIHHPHRPRFRVVEGGRRGHKPRRQRSSGSFMHRIEQRWQRRRDQGFGRY